MELHRMFLPEEISQYFLLVLCLGNHLSEACFFSLAESSLSAIFLSGACSEKLFSYIFPVSAPESVILHGSRYDHRGNLLFKDSFIHHFHSRKTPDEKLIHGQPTLISVQIP